MTPRNPTWLNARSAMTLVEMLVATAASLMLMAAIAQLFTVFGSAVTNSRSMIELDSRMRTVAWRLRQDLAGATARAVPPLEPSAGLGYLEIIEGPLNDQTAASETSTLAADSDDVLLFTTRRSDPPFIGKAGSAMVESPTAEVAWFMRSTTGASPQTYTLYRRQLLVVGYAGFGPFSASGNNTTTYAGWDAFYDDYDISVRREGSALIPNTLADLTRRETRFMHNVNGITNGSGFPYAFSPTTGVCFSASSKRVGEDVVLTNVLSFDVRVFDPAAPIGVSGNDALVAGDPGAGVPIFAVPAVANGCYVDLGNGGAIAGPSGVTPHFASAAQGNYAAQAGLAGTTVWDTWSTHYESNGVDEDIASGGWRARVDQGTDGLDNDGDGLSDETEEQETSPPYPFPLRGIEIRLRCYEPSSRQVRQVTVRHTFVPH